MAIVALTPFPVDASVLCTIADDDYKERRYAERIPYCQRRVSNIQRSFVYRRYHFELGQSSAFTVDHIVPLSLGGNNSRMNLYLEWKGLRDHRRPLENNLYWSLRKGCLNQVNAIKVILSSKYNPTLLNERPYREWGSLQNYLFDKHPVIWNSWKCD